MNKNLFSCGHCHKHFKKEDFKFKKRKYGNKIMIEKCCPYCGTIGVTKVNQEYIFFKYII